MTAHTDLIARLRRGWTTDCLLAADALESLEQQVAALTNERDWLSHKSKCLEMERASQERYLAAAQAREAKLRGVLDEAEKQLDLSQALLERSCHHHTILAAYKNVRTIREIPTDDSALMERLKQERENCADAMWQAYLDGEESYSKLHDVIRSMT